MRLLDPFGFSSWKVEFFFFFRASRWPTEPTAGTILKCNDDLFSGKAQVHAHSKRSQHNLHVRRQSYDTYNIELHVPDVATGGDDITFRYCTDFVPRSRSGEGV